MLIQTKLCETKKE